MTDKFLHSIDFAVWKDADEGNRSRHATVDEINVHVRIKTSEDGRAEVECDEGFTVAPNSWTPYR